MSPQTTVNTSMNVLGSRVIKTAKDVFMLSNMDWVFALDYRLPINWSETTYELALKCRIYTNGKEHVIEAKREFKIANLLSPIDFEFAADGLSLDLVKQVEQKIDHFGTEYTFIRIGAGDNIEMDYHDKRIWLNG